ncbi:MAG: DUF697 domain-containing protein [Blastocatellia bacterium]
MKKSFNANVENVDRSDANDAVPEQPAVAEEPQEADTAEADRAVRLEAAQDKVAQYLREERYTEAKRALKDAENIQAEGAMTQRLAEAKAEREKAVTLTNEGKYSEARQALGRADELEALVAGWKGRSKRFFASVRSRLPERTKAGGKDQTESAEQQAVSAEQSAAEPVAESLQIVSRESKWAAAVGLLPGGLLNFAAVLIVQVLMVRGIARAFGQKARKDQIRGVILSLFGAVIPVGIGHGAGAAIASLPAAVAGTVVSFVATPILAYALTRAVGNVFIMHFESGGTLLTFDPKAFTEYFVSEFKKAGGSLRQADEPVPAGDVTPA